MKKKNILKRIITAFVIILIGALCFCAYCKKEEKFIWERTFLEKKPIYTTKYMKKDGTSYNIDNFIITMEKYMYNEESDTGNIVLSVKKKNFETKKDRQKWAKNAEEIFNERFEVCRFSTDGNEPTYVFDKNILFIYCPIEQKKDYDDKNIEPIVVYDYFQKADLKEEYDFYVSDKGKAYFFPIESNSVARVYKIAKNQKIVLSPSAIVGVTEGEENTSVDFENDCKVLVYYKNGKIRKVIDTEDEENFSKYAFNRGHSSDDKHWESHRFSYALDVDNIDYIKVNGKKIKEFKEK